MSPSRQPHPSPLAEDIGYLKATCDAILDRLGSLETTIKETRVDTGKGDAALDHRVSRLERSRSWVLGAAAAFGMGGGVLADKGLPVTPAPPPVAVVVTPAPQPADKPPSTTSTPR